MVRSLKSTLRPCYRGRHDGRNRGTIYVTHGRKRSAICATIDSFFFSLFFPDFCQVCRDGLSFATRVFKKEERNNEKKHAKTKPKMPPIHAKSTHARHARHACAQRWARMRNDWCISVMYDALTMHARTHAPDAWCRQKHDAWCMHKRCMCATIDAYKSDAHSIHGWDETLSRFWSATKRFHESPSVGPYVKLFIGIRCR